MAGFDAGSIRALDLDWTFDTPNLHAVNKELFEGAKGRISEPTQRQLNAYYSAMLGAVKDAGLGDLVDLGENPSNEEVAKAVGDLDSEAMEKVSAARLDATLILCENGGPSRELLEALPAHVLGQFEDWLQGELENPSGTKT